MSEQTFAPKPMLAVPVENAKLRYPCFCQPKLNGERAIFYQGWLYSRTGKRFKQCVIPHILKDLCDQFINHRNLLIDGELYCHGLSLQQIGSICRVNRTTQHPDYKRIQFHIFDAAHVIEIAGGQRLDFFKRYNQFITYFKQTDSLKLVPLYEVLDSKHADDMYDTFITQGYEGIMYRLQPCYYNKGSRSTDLIKRKKFDTCRALVVDVFEGKRTLRGSKYLGKLGGVVCEAIITDKKVRFRVGSGFDDRQRETFWNDKSLILGKHLEVQYQYLNASGIPNHPVLKRILY